jgi:hypothetical protein
MFRKILFFLGALALIWTTVPVSPAPAGSKQTEVRSVLAGVTFSKGTTILKKESEPVLQALSDELAADPYLSITLEGYAWGEASEKQNLKISRSRALAVFNWLTAHGVAAGRIKYNGLGSGDISPAQAETGRIEVVKTRTRYPVAVFAEKSYTFEPVIDGTEVYHDFHVKNTGNDTLSIDRVRTG